MQPFEKISSTPSKEIWENDTYQVVSRPQTGGWIWLSIKRKDKKSMHDWRDFQLIKNMICGEEREAVELYPAESRLVDTSNQYHLWVLPEEQKFPFGYKNRLVVKGHKSGYGKGSSQRHFKEEEQPQDALDRDQVLCECGEKIHASYGYYKDEKGVIRCNYCEMKKNG